MPVVADVGCWIVGNDDYVHIKSAVYILLSPSTIHMSQSIHRKVILICL